MERNIWIARDKVRSQTIYLFFVEPYDDDGAWYVGPKQGALPGLNPSVAIDTWQCRKLAGRVLRPGECIGRCLVDANLALEVA